MNARTVLPFALCVLGGLLMAQPSHPDIWNGLLAAVGYALLLFIPIGAFMTLFQREHDLT